MNLENTSAIASDKNVVIRTNASVDNGTDNVVIGYQSSTRDDRGTIAGSMSVGTNSAGAALGDHIKVGNSCVFVGSWSNTAHGHGCRPSGRTCRRLRGTFPRRFAFPEIPGSGA